MALKDSNSMFFAECLDVNHEKIGMQDTSNRYLADDRDSPTLSRKRQENTRESEKKCFFKGDKQEVERKLLNTDAFPFHGSYSFQHFIPSGRWSYAGQPYPPEGMLFHGN